MTATRKTTISARKLAQVGSAYAAEWIGTEVVFTTWDGERKQGTITRFDEGNHYPIATFTDGGWARLDLQLEVVA